MDIHKYIKRIGFGGIIQANEKCLKELHGCHVMSVPFEALDVQLGVRINLDLKQIYHKVINGNRGGYCYELNYLFRWLLTEIGFENRMLSARIYDNEKFGPEFDHMALCVELKDLFLVDVGYGDLFIEPIKIESGIEQEDKFKFYKIIEQPNGELLLQESLKLEKSYINKYKFDLNERFINEFNEQNVYKQSSSESYFVKNRICTIATDSGRKTLLNNTFKSSKNSVTTKREVNNGDEINEILKKEFNIKEVI